MTDLTTKLRQERLINNSGTILQWGKIAVLRENLYYVKPYDLDGDAPKEFIHAYFYEVESGFKKKNLKSWPAYIAKTAEKWYPHESIIEFMINRIGQVLGLRMNDIKLVIANEQIRFLSKYFLNKGEILVHGAEICGHYLNDKDFAAEVAERPRTAREFFTFEFICEAIRNVYPNNCESIIDGLVRMIAFDALCGNNDRHFYNWGVIDYAKVTKKVPKFAPLYDSARGFVWNWSDEDIIMRLEERKGNGKKIDRYINDSAPRISFEDNKDANHFELVQFLKGNSSYKQIIMNLANEENEKKVMALLSREFFPHFIKERNDIVTLIVEKRFKTIREI
jgi:hypothetical protein